MRCWFPEPGDLAALPLRKPPTVAEHVRIVQYGDYEYCPCGGTHPPRTGMIGLFKILSAQPSKGFARIRFVCGGRAVKLLDTLYEKARQAGALLSCSYEDVPEILSLHIRQEEAQRHLLIDTVCGSAALQAENARAQGKNFALGMRPAGLEKTLSQAGAAMLENGL